MRTSLILAVVAVVALMSATAAHAQWKWRDADGRVNYSDQPPPPSVPASRVTQLDRSGAPRTPPPARTDASAPAAGPASAQAAATGSAQAPAAGSAEAGGARAEGAADAGAAPQGEPSWADRAMDLRKRRLEKQAAQRKAREQSQAAEKLAGLCEGARAELRTLESGMRVATVAANGEREFLEDDARAARIEVLRRDVRLLCKST